MAVLRYVTELEFEIEIEISWLAEELLASQERMHSMELVS